MKEKQISGEDTSLAGTGFRDTNVKAVVLTTRPLNTRQGSAMSQIDGEVRAR